MSESPQASGRPKGFLTWALWGAAGVGVAAVVYIIAQSSTKPAPQVATVPVPAPASTSFASKLTRPAQPTPPPDYVFYDAAGKALKVSDFKGKVVVMNLWATWCAPCKLEMPTLARMAAAYEGKPVVVIPISIDTGDDAQKAAVFIAQNAPLKFYLDRDAKLPFKLNPPAVGMPTTVIYGKDGMEAARVAGDADWTGADARAVIDKALGS